MCNSVELPGIHGAMAEFETPEDLIAAAERAYADRVPADGCLCAHAGGRSWRKRLGSEGTRSRSRVLIGGICGAIGGFGTALLDYRHRLSAQCGRTPAE